MKKIALSALAGILLALSVSAGRPAVSVSAEGEPSRCWAVIVGISDYLSIEDTLYGSKGAQEIYDVVAEVWPDENIRLLKDGQAAKYDVLSAVDWLASSAAPGDTVLFYFAGHGDDTGYLAPYNAYYEDTWISSYELRNRLNRIKSSRRVVIIDSCHAGHHETTLGVPGTVSLLSSRANQPSWEYGSLGAGVFTYFCIEALSYFDLTDADDDFALTAEEVFLYAANRTAEYTRDNEIQNPVLVDVFEGGLAVFEKLVIGTDRSLPAVSDLITLDGQPYSAIPRSITKPPGAAVEVALRPSVEQGEGTRYLFVSWDDGVTEPSRALTKGEFTAAYDTEYLLTVNSLYGEPSPGGWYKAGTKVTVSVPPVVEEPGTKRIFTKWTGSFSTTDPVKAYTLWKPAEVTALWRSEFQLTITSDYGSPSGAGWYDEGETARVTVEPLVEEAGTRHHFESWSGAASGKLPSASVVMDEPAGVTAEWWNEHLVTLVSEHGTLTGSGWYTEGDTAVITSSEIDGFIIRHRFQGWEGDVSGIGLSAEFTVDGPKTVTALWQTDLTQLYILLGGLAVAAVVVVLILKRRPSP